MITQRLYRPVLPNDPKRIPVPVAWYFEHAVDKPAFVYLPHHHDAGLDPWRIVSGVDCTTDRTCYFVEWGISTSQEVDPEFTLYIQERDLPDIQAEPPRL